MARYADGRSARIDIARIGFAADGLVITRSDESEHLWRWEHVERADDFVGPVILKRVEDSGERLTLDAEETASLREATPTLLKRPATRWKLVGGLAASAGALAAIFLVGIPLAAAPLAKMAPQAYVERLDQVAWTQTQALTEECQFGGSAGENALSHVLSRLAAQSERNPEVNVLIRRADFPNAFALPGGTIVVTDQLIALAEHPDDVAGVLAHELAHIDRRHNITNVIRSMGIGAFADIVLGGGGLVAAASINLAALRYSRADEAEADRLAVGYLDRAGLDPGGLSRLFDLLEEAEPTQLKVPEFISSHPDAQRRAGELRRFARPGRAPSLAAKEWAAVRAACEGAPEAPAKP